MGIIYLLGGKGLQFVHLPLNNKVQKLKIEELDNKSLIELRQDSKVNGIIIIRYEQLFPFSSAPLYSLSSYQINIH